MNLMNLCCWNWCLPKKKDPETILEYVLKTDLKEDCAICLEPLTVHNHISVLTCGHIFHTPCIYAWLHKKQTCPYCYGDVRI